MLFQELPTPFPIHDAIEKQARFDVNTDEPCGSSLISPSDAILPFQLRKTKTSERPAKMEILKASDNSLVIDISEAITAMVTVSRAGFDYITHLGQRLYDFSAAAWMDLKPGEYYVRLIFPDASMYYSEAFTVPQRRFYIGVPGSCPYLKLEWSNPSDISPLYYASVQGDRLVNVLYLDSNIKNSEPEIEIEGTQNGDNVLIPNFQKVTVKYRIADFVPDFVKLALSVMPIHENIVLTTEGGKRSGKILNVSVESTPEDAGGYFSDVAIVFEEALVIRRGCNDVMLTDPCPQLPAPGVIALNVMEAPNFSGLQITATLPAGTYADIYTSRTATTGFLSQSTVYASQLSAGYVLPYSKAFGPYVTLRIKTFECTSGDSARVQAAIAYDVKLGAYRYAIQTDPACIAANDNIFTQRPGAMSIYNDLFSGLRAGSGVLWDKTLAFYPFWAAGPDSMRFNAKDPRDLDSAYRLTAGGPIAGLGWVGDFGVVINGGTSGEFLDTHFDGAVANLGQSSGMLMTTSNFLAIENYNMLAGAYIANSRQWGIQISSNNFTGYTYGSGVGESLPVTLPSGTKAGAYMITRRSASDAEAFQYANSLIINPTAGNISIPPSKNITIGKMNGSPNTGSDVQMSFFAITSGLTAVEWGQYYTLISNFNLSIAFGR